jgi:hypothetical protein
MSNRKGEIPYGSPKDCGVTIVARNRDGVCGGIGWDGGGGCDGIGIFQCSREAVAALHRIRAGMKTMK